MRTWLAVVGGSMLFGLSTARAENWPQWRGPTDDGISKEANLPAEWSETKNLLWKLKLPGQSGGTPAVWGDRIFLTSQDGEDIVLMCIGTDGKDRWKRKLASGKAHYMRDEGNLASPSPSTDGQLVFTFTGTGDFACHDFEGKEVWKFNAQERYGKFRIQWGMHVTPLLHGDRLYLALLHSGGWWVIALDKSTGKDLWKVRRESDATAECKEVYASPCLATDGKEEYLVVHGCDYTTGHRLSDGSEIWRLGDLNPKNKYDRTLRFVSSPVATADLIVVPTAKGGPTVGVKPNASGSIGAGNAFEQWRRDRDTPDVPSPLVYDGLVYLCRQMGILICMDAKTGNELYQERLAQGRYRASPVFADGKIYCTARDGTFTVVKAGLKFEKLAENHLPDQFAASPAISKGTIYLRGFDSLYAVSNSRQVKK
jgi:outer membrane protein assembly factor BamB